VQKVIRDRLTAYEPNA